MEYDDVLSGRLLRLVAFQGNVDLWNAVLEELRPQKARSCPWMLGLRKRTSSCSSSSSSSISLHRLYSSYPCSRSLP